MRYSIVAVVAVSTALVLGQADRSVAEQLWSVHDGRTTITLDTQTLDRLGLRVESPDPDNLTAPDGKILLAVTSNSEPEFIVTGAGTAGGHLTVTAGTVHHLDGPILASSKAKVALRDLIISSSVGAPASLDGGILAAPSGVIIEADGARLHIASQTLSISTELAGRLGIPRAAGISIGSAMTDVNMAYMGGDPLPENEDPTPRVCPNPNAGPDVIVGDLADLTNYASTGTIDAFAVGTTSCNLGNVNLQWVAGSVNHPVIPQALYRLKTVNGSARMEQIGMSWMKHGFTALTQNLCCTCNGQGGVVLGQGCSDPYTGGLNGIQVSTTGGCGPRFQTNPHSGAFVWPYMFRGIGTISGSSDPNSISRRLQVQADDLSSTLNPGAIYVFEAQYVTPDDAAALNQNNNASYRPATFTLVSGSNYTAAYSGSTVRSKSGVQAWKAADASVTETIINTPEDTPSGQPGNSTGRCILEAKATDLGGGVWHYEYALYNMNSDRAISTVSVPVSSGLSVTNIGFHDVPYHSGDGVGTAQGALVNIDGTDWPGVKSGNTVAWAAVPLVAPANPLNTNVLRWGTTYNYRFDCNSPPTTGNVTLGLWKAVAGQPDTIDVATVIPTAACNAPVIDAIAGQNATCGSPFTSGTPTAAGTAPFTWTISAGGQPGMTINNATGVVSWASPVPSGSPYNVTLQAASQCSAATDTEVMSITVPFAADPTIDPIPPQNATCGAAFTSATPTSTGGGSWSITLGGQPGMTVNPSSGVVSWPSPTYNANPYQVTLQKADPCAANAASAVMSITVANGPTPTVNPIAAAATVCGVAFNGPTATATGGTPPYNWSLTGAPLGMTIGAGTGTISWPNPVVSPTPYSITVVAGDGCAAGTGSAVFQLTVKLGDFDGDGVVGQSDIPLFIDHLLGVSAVSPCAGDMNGDTNLDGLDVAGFVGQF